MKKLEDIKKIILLIVSIMVTVIIFIQYASNIPHETYRLKNISDITRMDIVKKTIVCVVIQLTFILVLQIKFKVNKPKYFAVALIVLVTVYFIPLTYKWITNVNKGNQEMLAQTTKGYGLIPAVKTHMLEGEIFKIRYMVFLITVIMLVFFIYHLIMAHIKDQKLWLKCVGTTVCMISCFFFSSNYLQKQSQRIIIEADIVESLTYTMSRFGDNKWGEMLRKSELEEIISQIKGKLSLVGKTHTNMGEKQQEMVQALEVYLNNDYYWEDEDNTRALQLMFGTVERNYFDFLIYAQPKNYLGIYLPWNFEEKYSEWFTPQAQCIVKYTTQ